MESFGVLFGRLVRERRGIEGLSQDELAGRSELTKARISDIETGKINNPQARTVDALCVALNISREQRDACRVSTGPRLPPRLLESLASRFGHSSPEASEAELEAFLKEKALEFKELQERLTQLNAAEDQFTAFLAAASAALEDGDFQLADKRIAEAEDAQLASTTLPALERQYRLRFERGHTALLGGEIKHAVTHWERGANYFHLLKMDVEAEKRYEYATRLREYGYRYRSVDALYEARDALEKNLTIWRKEENLREWCKVIVALGGVSWRLAQFDAPENYRTHIERAMLMHQDVRKNCSKTVLSYYYSVSGANISSIYAERDFAQSEEEYYVNLKQSLLINIESLEIISPDGNREDWGILQHNLGLIYIQFFQIQVDRGSSIEFFNKAIHHLEQYFLARDQYRVDELQYWVATCRSLGEALIERSAYQSEQQESDDLKRAYELLRAAEVQISEEEHPLQWAQIQEQLTRCSERPPARSPGRITLSV